MAMTDHRVPREVLDLALSQRDAALQMLAALFLTEEEAASMPCEGNDEDEVGLPEGWVGEMRKDVVENYRSEVLAMLRNMRIMTNSHAGYPLTAFHQNPAPSEELCQCFVDLRRFCEEYAAQDVAEPYGWLEQRLLAAGHAQADARWAIQETGGAEPMAMLQQMSRVITQENRDTSTT